MDRRYPYISVAAVSAAAIFLGHMALQFLPPTVAGLPTAVILILGMAGSVAAAIRWM